MDKKQLNNILSAPFKLSDWQNLLKDVFSVKRFLQSPAQILLPSNDKAEIAYELGSFNTVDDRIIGLYWIKVKPNVRLERNKVGLRELLRSIYKYDVDGAMIVFEQEEKWRLSFVSDIKVLNDKGEVVEQATEPKRYTYLLGKNAKIRTPVERLSKLSGKQLYLQDILSAFSVEALNEEFYKDVQKSFNELVDTEKNILQLPIMLTHTNEVRKEFAVRLIGRIVFCWFLKIKELFPKNKELLSSKAVKENSDYYHNILERIFFQILNTPMEERVKNLPKGSEMIPFLNGGLFEPNNDDFYRENPTTKLSLNYHSLLISDVWFLEFFRKLEQYNFTVDENSVSEVEVSVDPEMLGRIFENLLAEIDPDSGKTARKATGSFYTPREIVEYMATESLVQYLHNKTAIEQDRLRLLFKIFEIKDGEFSSIEKENILIALDNVKILDPACGSGAFPIGVLQKIVHILQKLDPNAIWWKRRQIARIRNSAVKNLLKEKLESSSVEYARKIGVIQNSLYGVDIQPIAAEISKLRCFLSLIVDENIDENKPNRGIEPLPNLEFKFVTANTLIKLTDNSNQNDEFNSIEELQLLEELRNEYIQSSGKSKDKLKRSFLEIREKIIKDQSGLWGNQDSRAYKLSNWNPFGHEKSDWFDSSWMFGIENFDIVIGNPPYGISIKGAYRENVEKILGKVPDYEIYYYFIEKSKYLLSGCGILSLVIPNTYLFNTFAYNYRNNLIKEWKLIEILDCTNFSLFKNAVVRNNIIIWEKGSSKKIGYRHTKGKKNFQSLINSEKKTISIEKVLNYNQNWGLIFSLDERAFYLIDKIKVNTNSLRNYFPEISQGLIAYDKYRGQSDEIIKQRKYHYNTKIKSTLKPWLWGSDINRYSVIWNKQEYIDYCDGIANPRQPKFFKGKRILIREITNPSIFAGYTDLELYNDPSIIIILENKSESIFALLGILNSKLATYFHFKNSPKATKGAFPKILVKDIKEFPLKSEYKDVFIEKIVLYILFLSQRKEFVNSSVSNNHIIQLFEEIIDAMVMELYFKEDFEKTGIEFIKYVERDFESIEGKLEEEQVEIINHSYQKLRQKDNEIRNNLKLMDIKLAGIVMPIKTGR